MAKPLLDLLSIYEPVEIFPTLIEQAITHQVKSKSAVDKSRLLVEELDSRIDKAYYTYDTMIRTGLLPTNKVFKAQMEKVKVFTEEAKGIKSPDSFVALDIGNVRFLIVALISEEIEVYQAKFGDSGIEMCKTQLLKDYCLWKQEKTQEWLDTYLKSLSEPDPSTFSFGFRIVHDANLAKGIVQKDGKRKYNTIMINGIPKVIKPEGWIEPDLSICFY